ARSITAGNLSERVSPSEGRTEVGQLGLALNTMLGELESAFGERDRTEQRLRQFLADASHELRTPLTSIQGFAELFRMGGGGDERPAGEPGVDLAVIMRRIEEESARMKTLVDDLRQAIANLVTNAVRHTPPGTPIEVSAGLVDGAARVAVRDHGAGLDDDALAHVFDRFWQADSARAGAGAGLGLAIVAGSAAEHGGGVTAGNAPGGGAVFTLELPPSSTATTSPSA